VRKPKKNTKRDSGFRRTVIASTQTDDCNGSKILFFVCLFGSSDAWELVERRDNVVCVCAETMERARENKQNERRGEARAGRQREEAWSMSLSNPRQWRGATWGVILPPFI